MQATVVHFYERTMFFLGYPLFKWILRLTNFIMKKLGDHLTGTSQNQKSVLIHNPTLWISYGLVVSVKFAKSEPL